MEKWDYPGINSKQRSRIPHVPRRRGNNNDEDEEGEGASKRESEEETAETAARSDNDTDLPPSGTNPVEEPGQSGSRTTQSSTAGIPVRDLNSLARLVPPKRGSSPDSNSTTSSQARASKWIMSAPSRGPLPPPSSSDIPLPIAPPRASTSIQPVPRPRPRPRPHPPQRRHQTSNLQAGLREQNRRYPENPANPIRWDDGGPTFGPANKPRRLVRFADEEVEQVRRPSGRSGLVNPERRNERRQQRSGSSSPTPRRRRRPTSPSGRPRHGRSDRLSPRIPARQGRRTPTEDTTEDTSSMIHMEAENLAPGAENWYSREFDPTIELPNLIVEDKVGDQEEGTPQIYIPRESSQHLPTASQPQREGYLSVPEAAETARDRDEIEARERRERSLSRERAVQAAVRHGMGETEEAEETENSGRKMEDGNSSDQRETSTGTRQPFPSERVPRDYSSRGGGERESGDEQVRPSRSRYSRSRSPPRERDFLDPDPGDPSGGGTGAETQQEPEGDKQTPQEPEKPEEPEKTRKREEKIPKLHLFLDRYLAKYRLHTLPPKDGKLRKTLDPYRVAKLKDLESMPGIGKRQRKLLQIKRRLNHYGMLATLVTSMYLICFGVAWQEHHRWDLHDRERRPVPTQPFAMWAVCMVWICLATGLNLLAIRTIYKLWVFGRVFKQWGAGEFRWERFSRFGLWICGLVGAVTIAAFTETVIMLREARALEIARGYWVPEGGTDLDTTHAEGGDT